MRETRLDSVIALRSGGLPAPLAAWVVARVAEQIASRPRIVSIAQVRVREDGAVRLLHDLRPAPFASRAPEVVQGGDGDPRAAVFALGVLLVELSLGRSPFERATDLETRLAVSEDALPRLEGRAARASSALDELISKATEKAAPDRHTSALELRDAIDAYLADELHDVGEAQLASTVREAIEQAPSEDRTSMPDYGDAELSLEPEAARSPLPNEPKFDQELVRLGDPLPPGSGAGVTEVTLTGVRESGPKLSRPELTLEVDDAGLLAQRERAARTRAPVGPPAPRGLGWVMRLGLALLAALFASIAYQFVLRPLLFD